MSRPDNPAGDDPAPGTGTTPGTGTAPATGTGSDGEPAVGAETGWQQLDRRSIQAGTLTVVGATAGAAVPVAIGLRFSEVSWGWTLFWTLGGTLVATILTGISEWIRFRSTTIRIGDRIEYHFRLGFVSKRSLSRDRVRTVEVTADPAQRLFKVATLRVGTGDQSGDDITFRSIDRRLAEELRVGLLRRSGMTDTGDGRPVGELARFRPGWVRYAPINFWTPALGGIAFGALMQVMGWFNAEAAFLRWFQSLFAGMPLWAEIGLIALGGLVVGAVANLAIFVEGWGNYRLEREPDGSLRVRRGLLVQRSTTFEEKRIRGVSIVEPLGVRLAGAARIDVLATGLRRSDDSKTAEPDTVLPPAPREVARRVAVAILGIEPPAELVPHPPAARRRRYVRAVATVIGVVGGLLLLGCWLTPVITTIGWIALAPVALIALAIARDNYAGLGHTVTDHLLVIRSGSVRRSTEIHYRPGLLGWTLQQSPLQRVSGLVTLQATTAAGDGGLRLPDVGIEQAGGLTRRTADEWTLLVGG